MRNSRAPPTGSPASRFGADGSVDPGTELALVDGVPNNRGIHNAGDLEFGKDGYLYATVGDGGCHYQTGRCAAANPAARELNTLLGKVVRITRDGNVPEGNPYRGTGTARCNTGNQPIGTRCQEIFASGLRNPFRFAFDPNAAATRFFINDVGAVKWEEIDEGRSGADYGWSVREGPCAADSYTSCGPPPVGMTNPIHSYRHDSGCTSITGGAFVPNGRWPAPYDGAYLFADFTCGKAFRLVPIQGGGYTAELFATSLPSPIHFEWGPVAGGGEALYYATFDTSTPSSPPGQVRRIRYVGDVNRPPSAAFSVTPSTGSAPLEVTVDASGSSDPDGDALMYLYDFGDGSPVEESATATAVHTYTADGNYTVTVRVRDPDGATSDPATAGVHVAESIAQVRVVAPGTDYRFSVGDRITLRAEATGADGQPLPGSAISWFILKHHDAHVHPFLEETPGDSIEIVAPEPEDLRATDTSYLEVRVTARDSDGSTVTTVHDVRPKLVKFGVRSSPTGVEITANGMRIVTNQVFNSWPGYRIVLSTPSSIRDGLYTFRHWSDAVKARERTVVTRAQDDYYTAIYKPIYNPF